MYFITYFLGIITGLVLAVIALLVIFRTKTTIERIVKQFESQLKTKGQILEPKDDQLSSWIEELPNEAHETRA